GDPIPIYVSQSVSDMYEVSSTYTNSFNADMVLLNPYEIVPGFDLPIQFFIINEGLEPSDEVTITVDGTTQHFDELSIAPNGNQMLTFYYEVPERIRDIRYDVTVSFSGHEFMSASGELLLDIPDVGLSNVRMQAEEGKRILSIPIF